MIDYASTVLYNWQRVDPSGPMQPDNIRCVLRMTGLMDEEWFYKTHVVIESEAAHVVSACLNASAARSDDDLLSHLVALEEALWRVVRACLPIMYERGDDGIPKCSEHVFYHVLRPLIKTMVVEFDCEEPSKKHVLHGPSGAMSSLLPCLDAVLGVPVSSEKLRDALAMFELSMPRPHRQLLKEVRTRETVRKRIQMSRLPGADGSYNSLARAFNRCIARLLDFRWQHWQYVRNFIMKAGNVSNAQGTGGTSFDYLQQHITDTERARLIESFDTTVSQMTPAEDIIPRNSMPRFNMHPHEEFWSVDGIHGFLSREPLGSSYAEVKGLAWPSELLEAIETVWDLAARMPALCVCGGPFRLRCEAAADQLQELQQDRLLASMSEVCREQLLATLCHIATGCIGPEKEAQKAPKCIDRPLQVLARSVGRQAATEFTELVLCNWKWGDAASCKGEDTGLKQMQTVWRFLASPDEEWYRATHILLHHRAKEIVAAIRVGQVAMREVNDAGLVSAMGRLWSWLTETCDMFDAHFEAKSEVTESVMAKRLAPFFAHRGSHSLTGQEVAFWLYCMGSSPLLPCIHAFLGFKMCVCSSADASENAGLQSLATKARLLLEDMRGFMPSLHREFVEEMEKPRANVRWYCFRRFGTKPSVEVLHDLETAYNDVLNALVRFMAQRRQLVSRFYPELTRSFDMFHAEVETEMRKKRLQLLRLRQRVFRLDGEGRRAGDAAAAIALAADVEVRRQDSGIFTAISESGAVAGE
jgi:hypothetical protein